MYVVTRLPKSRKVNAMTCSFLSMLVAAVGLVTEGVDVGVHLLSGLAGVFSPLQCFDYASLLGCL